MMNADLAYLLASYEKKKDNPEKMCMATHSSQTQAKNRKTSR